MSLRGDKYETTDEVRARLENTVVLYEDEPVYITRVSLPEAGDDKEVARVWFRPLPLGLAPKMKMGGERLDRDRPPEERLGEVRKFLSSRKFDLTPFKMGYMNLNGNAEFVSRAPARQYKQGLSNGVTTFTDVLGRRSMNVNFNVAVSSQAFVDMIKGEYPDFKKAGEMLGNKGCSSVAISRSFAFVTDEDLDILVLVNKGTKCGLAMKGDRAIKVSPKFHFLKQELEECRIPIA